MDDLIKKLKKMVNEETSSSNNIDQNNSLNEEIEEFNNSYNENNMNNINNINNNKFENSNEEEKMNININSNLNSINNENNNIIKQNHINTLASNNSDFANNNINNINAISQKNYCETQIDKPFTVSEMKLSRSRSSSKNKNKNHRFAHSLSEENNINNKVNNLSLISKTMYLEKENQDQITNLLTKTLAHIKSNKNNYDINLITNNINNVLDLYINSLSNQRLKNAKSSEKDIILQTKYETAEKMVKNFELKYLTSEKEKNKIIKQYNDLEIRFNKIKEKNEMNVQRNEEFLRLEKNNYVLLQTNEDLKKQINEINIQNDFVKKKYEDEIKIVKNLLNQYHQQLVQLQNKIFNSQENNINNNNQEENIINEGRNNNIENNNYSNQNNEKSLTLNSF